MTDPQPTGAAQAIVDFLEHSRQHFGLPERRRSNTGRRLGCLLVAGTLGALAGTAYADDDLTPPARQERAADNESRPDTTNTELQA